MAGSGFGFLSSFELYGNRYLARGLLDLDLFDRCTDAISGVLFDFRRLSVGFDVGTSWRRLPRGAAGVPSSQPFATLVYNTKHLHDLQVTHYR